MPGPDTAGEVFTTRYLISEPSAWTSWVRPEWPRIRIVHKATPKPRASGELVGFVARSGFVNGLWPQRARDAEPFFFRVTIRRRAEEAFHEGTRQVLVGKMLEVPLSEHGGNAGAATADDSLERDMPLEEHVVTYEFASELVWRRGAGIASERVLRMFETAETPVVARVPGRIGSVEASLAIELEISVG